MKKIYVVGIGPGDELMMTAQAKQVLDECDVIVSYSVYLELLGSEYSDKEFISTPMRQEIKRCELCFE